MAWYGSKSLSAEQSPTFMLLYWTAFLFCLLVAMYMVILDIRFIRMHYIMGQREIYRGTLANEEFRKTLIEAIETQNTDSQNTRENSENELAP